MKKSFAPVAFLSVILAVAIGTVVAAAWANIRIVQTWPAGDDFWVHWTAARALIFDGQSPYSEEVTRQIREGLATSGGQAETGFTSPLYALLLYAPLALIGDYVLARAIWMTALQAAVLLAAFLSVRLVGWEKPGWLWPFLLLFSLFWLPSAFVYRLGSSTPFAFLLLALALFAIKHKRDELAGLLLAFSLLKPAAALVALLLVVFWAASQRRWRILGFTLGFWVFLVLFGMLFVAGWPLQNYRAALTYHHFRWISPLLDLFSGWWPGVGQPLAWVFAGALLMMLILEWRSAWGKSFEAFLWCLGLVLAVSLWPGWRVTMGDGFPFVFPILLAFSMWAKRWRLAGKWFVLVILLAFLILPWYLWVAGRAEVSRTAALGVFFLPVLVIVSLYWVRWWFIKPTLPFLNSA